VETAIEKREPMAIGNAGSLAAKFAVFLLFLISLARACRGRVPADRRGYLQPFRLRLLRKLAVQRYLLTQQGTRHIALLCGAFRSWPELYEAGRALFDFWLELQRHDLYMQPMGSMLTNRHYAAEIARRFECEDCWLVVRLGYSDVPPRAPRLENILINE